jgi:EAL domain-containing protein (putative c-di-GMP-specific phosphodiesterase class I)
MQGYLFARPLSPAAIEQELDRGRTSADAAPSSAP